MTSFFKIANKKRSGLTLTELAIVLGGMGLVMGAVWAIASVVWDSYRFYKMKEQLVAVVTNVRDFYGPMGGIYTNAASKAAYADGTDVTQALNANDRRLIPVDMRADRTDPTSVINHALATDSTGSFHAESQLSGRRLRLRLYRLSQPNCIKLLMDFPVLMPEMGVRRIAGNANTASIDITNIASPGGAVSLPMSLTTASSWCSVTGSVGNEVNFDFEIKN